MKELDGGKIAVGLIVNGIIIYALSQYSTSAALVYTTLLFLLVFFTYRDRIFGSINATLGYIQATK